MNQLKSSRLRILCIGEAMVELSQLTHPSMTAQVGFAGDTLNTAIYLSRLLDDVSYSVSYLTVTGTDPLSRRLLDVMQAEGLDTTSSQTHPTKHLGLYAIHVDDSGERSFTYWRDQSAARTLFENGDGVDIAIEPFDVIYLSGITLAILSKTARAALIEGCAHAKREGKMVVFDSNYRPQLWESAETAREACSRMWEATRIGLPSLDDELLLRGVRTEADVLAHLTASGVEEIALKRGSDGTLLSFNGKTEPMVLPLAKNVVDTTAAGDSFNAGYIFSRVRGHSPRDAAFTGHRVASTVITHRGAIIPKSVTL